MPGPLLLALVGTLIPPIAARDAPPPRPHIIIIYADDLGYGDVQCYNPERGRIPTPH